MGLFLSVNYVEGGRGKVNLEAEIYVRSRTWLTAQEVRLGWG
jgi:hypothetical protein